LLEQTPVLYRSPHFGAFAVLEYHHSDTDAFAPIQYIIRSESVRFSQDLTDTAFGAAGSIRNRTNGGVLSNEHVHQATHASQFRPRIKAYRAAAGLGPTSEMGPRLPGNSAAAALAFCQRHSVQQQRSNACAALRNQTDMIDASD
jgi:hypothetical protein